MANPQLDRESGLPPMRLDHGMTVEADPGNGRVILRAGTRGSGVELDEPQVRGLVVGLWSAYAQTWGLPDA